MPPQVAKKAAAPAKVGSKASAIPARTGTGTAVKAAAQAVFAAPKAASPPPPRSGATSPAPGNAGSSSATAAASSSTGKAKPTGAAVEPAPSKVPSTTKAKAGAAVLAGNKAGAAKALAKGGGESAAAAAAAAEVKAKEEEAAAKAAEEEAKAKAEKEAAEKAAKEEAERKKQEVEKELARLAALANGEVTIKYNMYSDKFKIENHKLTAEAIDDVYCLSYAMPGCFIHLADKEYKHTEEPQYIKEDPPGTFVGLMSDETYWCYVQQDPEQEKKDQAAMKAKWAGVQVGGGLGDRGSEGETCSCGWGAPCTNPMICKDWDNRFANAIKAGGNPILFTG